MLLFQAGLHTGEHGSGEGRISQLPSAVDIFLSAVFVAAWLGCYRQFSEWEWRPTLACLFSNCQPPDVL